MKLFERIKEYILPYMLAFFLCTSIFRVYNEDFFTVYNLASAVIILAVFIFLGFWRKHMAAGSLIYFVMAVLAVYLMIRLAYADDWGESYTKWFLSAGEDAKFKTRYFLAFLSVFPFFFATIVYYFSMVLYRTSFLMLLSLVPCALYIKVLSEISDGYLICIAGLNIAIYVINTRKRRLSGVEQRGEKAYILSAMAIVAVSLVIASLIPKQGEAIHYEVFEKYFMDAGTGDGNDFSALGKHSSRSDGYRNLSYSLLYEVNAPDLLYFRKQNFDLYNSEEHCFYPLKKYSTAKESRELLIIREQVDLNDMLWAMKAGYDIDKTVGIDERLAALNDTSERFEKAEITPVDDYEADYFITSLRTFTLSEISFYITQHGEILPENGKVSGSYSLYYYPESDSERIWLENGGADFTDESYSDYLRKLETALIKNNEQTMLETVLAFESEFKSAMEYKEDISNNNKEIPDKISKLALSITDGCEYDWQKAQALQDYFQSGEYVYDLEYVPPKNDDPISYFIFESKRGICSDFAAAYTLLARSAGLTVRYTEGFAPQLKTGPDTYRILKKDAHAYPEVYIHNTGWMVFDPTAASTNNSLYNVNNTADNTNAGINFSIDTGILISVIKIMCVVFGTAAVIIIIAPMTVRICDNIRIRRGGTNGIILAYKRISNSMENRFKVSTKPLTPEELRDELKIRTGTDMSRFIALYESVCFGGAVLNKNQNDYIYNVFRDVMKQINKKSVFRFFR